MTPVFHRFPDIENLELAEHLQTPDWLNASTLGRYVVTEKIDGANISLNICRDAWNVAKRTGVVTEQFYHIDANLPLLGDLVEKTTEMLAMEDTEVSQISLCGEYYGSKVMNRIDYGCDFGFRFFGMYRVVDGQVEWSSFDRFLEFMREIGHREDVVPVLGLFGSFEEACRQPNDSPTVMPGGSGVMEGIVIQPYEIPGVSEDGNFRFKSKNDLFRETTVRRKPSVDDQMLRMRSLHEEFLGYLTENRMYGIFSKLGMPASKKDTGRYLAALKEDAVKDFLKEHPEATGFSKEEAKFVLNPGSKGYTVFTVVTDRMRKS